MNKLEVATKEIECFDSSDSFETNCPECGKEIINGKCPSPASHNGGVN